MNVLPLLQKFPLAPQHTVGPLVLCIFASLALIFEAAFVEISVYHHSLICQGEVWRLLTGHLLHTNLNHFLLNLAGIILLWALHGHFYKTTSYLSLFIFCAIFCSVVMFYLSPEINQYVGLSGALHGVFVWGACKDIADKDKTGYLLLFGVIAKLLYEQHYGASVELSELIQAPVAVDAHLWGAISGALYFLLVKVYDLFTQSKR